MIDFFNNFHFLRPWLLLFFVLPLGLYLKKIRVGDTFSSWENICDKNLLGFMLTENTTVRKIPLKKLMYIGLFTTVIAAAGPSWQKKQIPTFSIENPSIFVLSLAQDMQLTDVSPSRLERAKFMISDITEKIPQGQFGLEVYSQEPYIISPLTEDIKLIKNLLPQIVPNIVPDQGDRPDRAIELAIERFRAAGYASGNIVLFASDVGQRFDFAMDKVQQARDLNYTVNIVDSSFSGSEKLQMLAEKGNGVYLSVKEVEPVKLIERIQNINNEKARLSQNLHSNYLDFGYYLLLIPLLCMLPFFRKGVLVLAFCCFSFQANAGFFLNNDQEGFKLFSNKEYDLALTKFKDSLWRGITLYKLEKNEEALAEFSKSEDDNSLYNQGVILTKMCKYQDAFDAFSKALKINSKNENAAYNKEILENLFEKAKEDPSVLECQDNQQQQKQQNQNNSEKNQDNSPDNSSKQNKSKQDDSEDNNEQNNSQNHEQENSESNENKNSDPSEQNSEQEKPYQSSQNSSQNGESKNDKKDDNTSSFDSNGGYSENKEADENKDSTDKANKDDGKQSKSHNRNGRDDGGNQEQNEQREAPVMNAKEGNEDTEYDEEALAMQRRYREIPEDTGGLLREFIKKEHMKDRYNDENK